MIIKMQTVATSDEIAAVEAKVHALGSRMRADRARLFGEG